MPKTTVVFYQDEDERALVLEWLTLLKRRDAKGWANCKAKIERLSESGHELRRPAANLLRDGIYELRAKHHKVQYRILYFFDGKNFAILAHSVTKRDSAVDNEAIEKAIERKIKFKADPKAHTYSEEE